MIYRKCQALFFLWKWKKKKKNENVISNNSEMFDCEEAEAFVNEEMLAFRLKNKLVSEHWQTMYTHFKQLNSDRKNNI